MADGCLPLFSGSLQVGDASPDVEPKLLKAAFNTTQQLLEEGKLLAGHDISDGGIVTAVRTGGLLSSCCSRKGCTVGLTSL